MDFQLAHFERKKEKKLFAWYSENVQSTQSMTTSTLGKKYLQHVS